MRELPRQLEERELVSHSVEETLAIGRRLGEALVVGDVVALVGPLGAGKTHLVKGVAAGLGGTDSRRVTSPTFVIVQEYEGRLWLFHVDAYRLGGAGELEAVGFEEFAAQGVVVVEWADKVAALLPPDHLEVVMELTGPESRRLTLRALGSGSARLLSAVAHTAG